MGIGAQDNLDLAQQFIERTGIESFEMYWDPTFDSWRHFGVQRNSEAWLINPDGTYNGDRFFGFDVDQILGQVA